MAQPTTKQFESILVANRGEIACRIIRSAKALGIRTVAIFTPVDQQSMHVADADVAIELTGGNSSGYINIEEILQIATRERVCGIAPGYGFLSENANFARAVVDAGMVWIGPSPETIECFGVKHTARKLASDAGVPIVPGTAGLVPDAETAVIEATQIGYPVMLKATAGGGGMGLQVCRNDEEVLTSFASIVSRGQTLFHNSGVFIERFFSSSRHIEVQIFGNGLGDAISYFERECSIQRRHQKVIEECPSPFVEARPDLRNKISSAAIKLAQSVNYKSAGTVEFLVDDSTGEFFFLEMNTRLQVEHGITELCYSVDLVELMLKQAIEESAGHGGLQDIKLLQPVGPHGHAIECRLYAENPARNNTPAPGLLQEVKWATGPGIRIDTWVRKGTEVSAFYDPMIAKVLVHADTRMDATAKMLAVLQDSVVAGPPTNFDYLSKILECKPFQAGDTTTSLLSTKFTYKPCAMDIISGGALTTIQDLPAWKGMPRGIPESGPMDPIAHQIANILVGNDPKLETLEITSFGPEILFHTDAVVSVCGAPIKVSIEEESKPMWASFIVKAGSRLIIGATTGNGCRSYLAVHGGFPNIATFNNSKSTSVCCLFGGYQGRRLAAGDLLYLQDISKTSIQTLINTLPAELIPTYHDEWEIYCMPGPHEEGFLTAEGIEHIYTHDWTISHNASRGGISIIGQAPTWARIDGGEGGAHPTNVLEYGTPLGALNWTGQQAVIYPVEAPSLSGFLCSTTVIRAEWWRLGQVKPGDKLKFKRISATNAKILRLRIDAFIAQIPKIIANGTVVEPFIPLDMTSPSDEYGEALLAHIPEKSLDRPDVYYRQGGDDFLLVSYGNEHWDLNHKGRAGLLEAQLTKLHNIHLIKFVSCHTSLMIQYDSMHLDQRDLLNMLMNLEDCLGSSRSTQIPNRTFTLPISWNDSVIKKSIAEYTAAIRSKASYLPDNVDYVEQFNDMKSGELLETFLGSGWVVIYSGFYMASFSFVNIDPRKRLTSPKWNPPRGITPKGTIGYGGASACIYNGELPGGYQMFGRSIPGWDFFCLNEDYAEGCPWIYNDFDVFEFELVSEEEYNKQLANFHGGQYKYNYRDSVFDMGAYNKFVDEVSHELPEIQERRAKAAAVLGSTERELFAEWQALKLEAKNTAMDTISKWKSNPNALNVASPMKANVWKVLVEKGDIIKTGQVVAILEAMKMEVNVVAEASVVGAKVQNIAMPPGSIVEPGDPLIFLLRV